MNAKYCKLIRKVARDWGYSNKMAKRVKKILKRYEISNPSIELLMEVFTIIDTKIKS